MKVLKSSNDSQKEEGNLRNFDLSVEEIRTIKAIREMTRALEALEVKNTQPERVRFIRNEIIKLEEELEEIRENTLIQ